MEESTTAAVEVHPQQPAEKLPANLSPQAPVPPSTFTKVDNNLTGIGFFTASSKRSRKEIEKTTVVVDQGVEHRISILPSAKYGLPITQDQDYWLALMKLVTEYIQREGKLKNPFAFTSAELTKILGQAHSGKNYKAVQEWADVMSFTGIQGGAYDATKKRWIIDRTHAVERFVTIGKELPDGTIADKNYIWFSQWQLDNINSGNLIPIELGTYTQLENNISKNLVPHLQEWLLASQRDGRFEKQYEDVCQLLGIRVYQYRSDIERQVGPSLNELTTHGYLSKWAIEPMANRKNYKLVIWHGQKYHADRQTRLEKKSRFETLPAGGENSPEVQRPPRQRRLKLTPVAEPESTPPVVIDYRVIAELAKRGVGEADARGLLANLPPGQPVLDQLEWGDYQIAQGQGKIKNPPGFYISLLQRNVPVPSTFETSQARKARERAEFEKAEALLKERQAAMAAEEAESAALQSQLDGLAEGDRLALFAEVKAERLAIAPQMAHWLTTADPEVNSFLHAGARLKLKNGWLPSQTTPEPEIQQQTINQPPRQDTPLQELPPVSDVLNLKALLSTPQLPAPSHETPVEQPSSELAVDLL